MEILKLILMLITVRSFFFGVNSSYHSVALECELSSGAFGKALLLRNSTTDQSVVCKQMIKQNPFVDSCVAAESGLAKTLASSYLVRVFDSVIESHPSGMKIRIYMEYCDGGTLHPYIPKLRELQAEERRDVCVSFFFYSFKYILYSSLII